MTLKYIRFVKMEQKNRQKMLLLVLYWYIILVTVYLEHLSFALQSLYNLLCVFVGM